MEELLGKKDCCKADLRQLKKGMRFPDIRLEIVKNLHEVLKAKTKAQQTPQFMMNTLMLVDIIVLESNFVEDSDEEDEELCKDVNSAVSKASLKPNYAEFKRHFTQLWSEVMKWEKTRAIHKRVLSLLPEKVIQHLTKPLHMSDYFLSAFDFGKFNQIFIEHITSFNNLTAYTEIV